MGVNGATPPPPSPTSKVNLEICRYDVCFLIDTGNNETYIVSASSDKKYAHSSSLSDSLVNKSFTSDIKLKICWLHFLAEVSGQRLSLLYQK